MPALPVADIDYLLRVGRNDHAVQQWRGADASVDVADHGYTGNIAESFPLQPGRRKARRDYGNGFHGPE
jgi:hypothetical protein